MGANQAADTQAGDPSGNNALPQPELASTLGRDSHILKKNGWLCGFRVDNLDGPALVRQVASHIDEATLVIEESNDVINEVITTYNKRESNYVHHGWSVGAITAVSPRTLSRTDATNRHNAGGTWITRRTLSQRLKVQVLPEDLTPTPEFEVAVVKALGLPTRFEKFQAVYRVLNRWGDVVPLEMGLGSSLSLTDTEGNYAQLPVTIGSLNHLSTFKTANLIRKGPSSNTGWDDGTWTTIDVPATEWRLIRIIAVAPTLSLLSHDIQTQLADLHNELLAYNPPPTLDPIIWPCIRHDDVINSSRTISKVEIRCGNHIVALKITYLDGVTSGAGGNGGIGQTFSLANGEHIVEMLTCADGEWLRAIQFITNKGRSSAIYGKFEGTLAISRSEGGVLSGLSISTKEHPEHGHWITAVNGIWRHDLVPRAPKENDVYSDYISGKTPHGTGFNDRPLIGNSNSMYISSIEVRAHGDIHSVEFTYTYTKNGKICKIKSPRHGGSHGPYFRFDLEQGEHIVSVTGTYNDRYLRQLCFATNLGRTSDVYGMGGGQSFSARAPLDETGRSMRLQYVLGRCDAGLVGIMFAWTPGLPS